MITGATSERSAGFAWQVNCPLSEISNDSYKLLKGLIGGNGLLARCGWRLPKADERMPAAGTLRIRWAPATGRVPA
jgi:hypothetical protein